MTFSWPRLTALVAALAGFCAEGRAKNAPLLLISLDGFRWDYIALHPEETPHLRQLQREGVSARGLIPSFPSQTFTSHYSIVTGLRPARHGIIANNFYDPTLGAVFNYRNTAAQRDPRWWQGEPIWITAVKQGLRSACYFWVGSEVPFGNLRATIAMPFDSRASFENRFDQLFRWLTQPEDQRPHLITFYMEETNSAGHYQGIDSDGLTAAIKLLDDRVGRIIARAREQNVPLNLVVVSDHGMVKTNGETQTTILDDYIDLRKVQVDFDGPVAGLRPLEGDAAALVSQLTALPRQYKVYGAEDLPARWHLRDNPRIPPVWIVPEAGWRIQRRAALASTRDHRLKGEHGYDNALETMHGIFIAHGPAFRSSVSLEPLENIHVYNLLCATLGISPAPNDGDDQLARTALLRP